MPANPRVSPKYSSLQLLHIPTRRKPATAIKRRPRARAGFRGSQRQCAPAFRARGGAGKSRIQIGNVLAPGGPRLGQHAGLDGQNNVVHLLAGEEHIALTLDVGHIAVRDRVCRGDENADVVNSASPQNITTEKIFSSSTPRNSSSAFTCR